MTKRVRLMDTLIERARALGPLKVAVAHPASVLVLGAVAEAAAEGLIEPVLVGPLQKIMATAREAGVDISDWRLVEAEHSHAAAEAACALAASGEVAALMKGSLHSDELLHAVLTNPRVRGAYRLSHVYLFDDPEYHKPFMVTDGAINIAPTLAHKADIICNAARLFRALNGADAVPKVAVLAAVEMVNPAMAATIDAACLSKMAERGQLGACIVDGPLALDNAISKAAAKEKGIVSEVAGEPDILLVPDLEAGNMLAKQLTFLGDAEAAAIVMGARLPIILTSRADNQRTRLASCALAVLCAHAETVVGV
jgi:phosphate acetyltransferase/phosphate butyryltransferase